MKRQSTHFVMLQRSCMAVLVMSGLTVTGCDTNPVKVTPSSSSSTATEAKPATKGKSGKQPVDTSSRQVLHRQRAAERKATGE